MRRKNKTIGTVVKIKNPDAARRLAKVLERCEKIQRRGWKILLRELRKKE